MCLNFVLKDFRICWPSRPNAFAICFRGIFSFSLATVFVSLMPMRLSKQQSSKAAAAAAAKELSSQSSMLYRALLINLPAASSEAEKGDGLR